MFQPPDLDKELFRIRAKSRKEEDALVQEARRILQDDLFADKKVLENLKDYGKSLELLDEREVTRDSVFSTAEIRHLAIKYRLRFLPLDLYKPELSYESELRLRELNTRHRRQLKRLFVLAPSTAFHTASCDAQHALFAETNEGNYFLVHRSGRPLSAFRSYKYWPLRSFENLLITVLLFTLFLTLSLPTAFITLDSKATYWSGYRAAAFFHLFIFNCGFTVYLTFAFSRNFSSTVWNRKKDFG